MNDRTLQRLLTLCTEMADIIYRYQQQMKPREADKARQARQLIKKWKKKILADTAPTTGRTAETT